MQILKNKSEELIPEHSDNTEPSMWNHWNRNQEWRDKLAKKASYKSLDIVDEDEMNINSGNTTNGIGIRGLIAMGLLGATGLGAAVAGGAYLADYLKTNKTIETITTELIDYEVDMKVDPPE